MDIVEGELADLEDKVIDKLRNFKGEGALTFTDQLSAFVTLVESQIDNFKICGDFQIDSSTIKKERLTVGGFNGSKENGKKNDKGDDEEPVRRSTRAKVLTEISTNTGTGNTIRSRNVKLEKISENSAPTADVVVKSEMPPPLQPARRGRKKKATTIVTSNDETSDYSRDSDVVLQKQHVSIINLSDSDEDETSKSETNKKNPQVIEESNVQEESQTRSTRTKTIEVPAETTARSTRTKTRTKAQETVKTERDTSQESVKSVESSKIKTKKTKQTKRSREKSSEDEEQLNSKPKRSKSLEEPQQNADQTYVKTPPQRKLNETVAKPADTTTVLNQKSNIADATVVIERLPNVANETIVVSKTAQFIVTTPLNKRVDLNDLMTDDEDDGLVEKTPVKGANKTPTMPATKAKNGPSKPIFSTFENSPVKKRVEAFEKLKADMATEEPPRMTRTKTKAKQTKEQGKESLEPQPSKLPIKDKSKCTPQQQNRFLPATFGSSSASKMCKSSVKDIMLPTKSASALKACQQEFMEREIRRQKEQEAIKKRDALLQARKEENRRKREEKQLKAQHTRAALEKDKQKMLEDAERVKEERYKQMMAEKTEKLQKQRDEVEAKRILAMKKAQEEKRKEQNPIYLDQTAPLLPTGDCYDSDDDRRPDDVNKPPWMRRVNMYPVLKHIHFVGDKCRNTLFMCEATTPDLREMFEKINPNKLKRSSSAVWRKAPRFTIMPVPSENIDEVGDY